MKGFYLIIFLTTGLFLNGQENPINDFQIVERLNKEFKLDSAQFHLQSAIKNCKECDEKLLSLIHI